MFLWKYTATVKKTKQHNTKSLAKIKKKTFFMFQVCIVFGVKVCRYREQKSQKGCRHKNCVLTPLANPRKYHYRLPPTTIGNIRRKALVFLYLQVIKQTTTKHVCSVHWVGWIKSLLRSLSYAKHKYTHIHTQHTPAKLN
jgi:hypothetical protein